MRCGRRLSGAGQASRSHTRASGAEEGLARAGPAGQRVEARKSRPAREGGKKECTWADQQASRPSGGGKEWAGSEARLEKEEKKVFK